MLLVIDKLLSSEEVAQYRAELDAAPWIDGLATAGTLSAAVKDNEQLDELSPLAIRLGNEIVRRLGTNPLFIAAALPERIYPPKFNRYAGGGHYGAHVDSAIMRVADANLTIRTDLSATLFLCDPDEYDGGELTIEGEYGAQAIKLEAGDMVVYPASSLHMVTPVTRGARVCAFLWVQSMVRDEGKRTLLFDLDQSIQALSGGLAKDDPNLLQLTGVYHNLLRRWAVV